ncbi:MAG: ATP-binding protein [Crocinitomicaceae bacterium]
MKPKKTYLNWSTGKDSALSLYYLLNDPNYRLRALVTSVNTRYDRVSMHGLRRTLMEKQLQAIGIPYYTVELLEMPSMTEYEKIMRSTVEKLKSRGFTHAAFGDIFLEDLKAYRENQLNQLGIKTVFPLWKKDSLKLVNEFIDLGFKAIVVTAKESCLGKDVVGEVLTKEFIAQLPEDVDPAGEYGEFHTFCYDGPIFSEPVAFEIGEKIYREYDAPKSTNDNCHLSVDEKVGFWYCDLTPVGSKSNKSLLL